ncbi:MAG: Polysaccharide deacetylase/glycosyl transferase, group 2 family protein [bacterium]|nr:Polysaccharide deacetylase/glycosyl transferase, group 2 family protein [bacterium]
MENASAATNAQTTTPAPLGRDAWSPRVTAFVDPTVTGAIASLRAHAPQLSAVAFTGFLLDDDGSVIDRLDRSAVRAAAEVHVRALALVQNLDEHDGRWRPDRVRALARDDVARRWLGAQLAARCGAARLDGVHLDLEELDDDWRPLAIISGDVARALHARGLELSVDVPASIDADVLAALGRVADHVVVMAYDEHDADGPPGTIASDGFVADTLAAATRALPTAKLTAGLAIYGYDWIGDDSADPISFVDAHAAAREARVEPRWDAGGNVRFQYSDDEGAHQVWLTDAASVWNQSRLAAAAGVHEVALWRLGGEDPGIWDALAHLGDSVPPLASVPPDARVTNEGDGPFLSLALAPEPGRRTLRIEDGRIRDERWLSSPSPYLVRRAGIVAGQVALTFDDGPDPTFTPQILDILRREHVPATFFVIGARAAAASGLVERMNADGHEVGNHTLTHPDVDNIGGLRLRTELESTTQIVASIIGRRPLLYRPPSLADVEPRTPTSADAFARAGSLGYLVVDADVDPRDWEKTRSEDVVHETLAQAANGGVILLHDGGGDRSATVQALHAIIAGLRARGQTFVPLSQLVGKRRDEVMPRVDGAPIAGRLLRVVLTMHGWLRAILFATLLVIGSRALFVILAAVWSERRRRTFRARGPLPRATAVIPAFNEGAVIVRTIDSVLDSDVPVEVVVIDDGSSDDTAAIVARRYLREPRVRLIRQANGGKASALRAGIAACRTEVIIALDADTLFAPTTVRRLIEPMFDPRVAAVAGTAEVGNLENGWARWQAVEYLTQQELERRAWDALAAVPIVPGAVGAWRRRALIDAGGFSSDTLAEDADLAMALCRRGWRVVHAATARARTEVPVTRRALVKQRVRWSFGVLQALWKHRRALIERRSGAFGRVVAPAMLLFLVALPLAAPAAILALALAVGERNFAPALVSGALLAGVELAQFAVACILARRSGAAYAWRLLPSLLTARLFYRPILWGVTLRSIVRLADGVPLGWGKLARRNTAVAYAVATAPARATSG